LGGCQGRVEENGSDICTGIARDKCTAGRPSDGVFSQEEFDRAKANLDKESQERKKADGVGAQHCLTAEHRDILGDSQAMVNEREHSREQASVSKQALSLSLSLMHTHTHTHTHTSYVKAPKLRSCATWSFTSSSFASNFSVSLPRSLPLSLPPSLFPTPPASSSPCLALAHTSSTVEGGADARQIDAGRQSCI
jgi:hypothetical protein